MTIVKRGVKGTALTYDEMDENIRDLYQDTTIDRVLGNGNTTTKTLSLGTLNASTTIDTTTITINGQNKWKLRESSGTLIFSYAGVDKMKIDSNGNLTVVGNVTGYGTI
jgi:hypothetical protein